jgi:hypothetical protein
MLTKKSKIKTPKLVYINTVKSGYFPGDRIKRDLVLALSEERTYLLEKAFNVILNK